MATTTAMAASPASRADATMAPSPGVAAPTQPLTTQAPTALNTYTGNPSAIVSRMSRHASRPGVGVGSMKPSSILVARRPGRGHVRRHHHEQAGVDGERGERLLEGDAGAGADDSGDEQDRHRLPHDASQVV